MSSQIPNEFITMFQNIDPRIEKINEDKLIPEDSILTKLKVGMGQISGSEGEANFVTVYGVASSGETYIGDTYKYVSGNLGGVYTGRLKTKKYTSTITCTRDDIDRVRTNGSDFIENRFINKIKIQSSELVSNLEKALFGLTAADQGYDPEFVSPFALNATSTVANPQDCNQTAGTPCSLTGIKWSGTAQTMNNVDTLNKFIKTQIAKIKCSVLKKAIDWGKRITLIVNDYLYAILTTVRDIKTSNQISNNTYIQDLANLGYDVILSPYADTTNNGTVGSASTMVVVGDIGNSFIMKFIPNFEGFNWTPWERMDITENGVTTIGFQRRKSVEWYLQSLAYGIRNADGSFVWKKTVMHVNTIPEANS